MSIDSLTTSNSKLGNAFHLVGRIERIVTAVLKRDKKVMSRSQTLADISDRLQGIQKDLDISNRLQAIEEDTV